MKQTNELTRDQSRVLQFIIKYKKMLGVSPTHEEISLELDIPSTTVAGHINSLVMKGYVTKKPKQRRSLEILREVPDEGWM